MEDLHFLTTEEEAAIKASVPWEDLDKDVRDLILLANKTEGLATVQSCAGHVHPEEDAFNISMAHVVMRVTKDRMIQILEIAPQVGIKDVSLRYFSDGTFWMKAIVDPSERELLHALFRKLQ